jgi:hypothetical protein
MPSDERRRRGSDRRSATIHRSNRKFELRKRSAHARRASDAMSKCDSHTVLNVRTSARLIAIRPVSRIRASVAQSRSKSWMVSDVCAIYLRQLAAHRHIRATRWLPFFILVACGAAFVYSFAPVLAATNSLALLLMYSIRSCDPALAFSQPRLFLKKNFIFFVDRLSEVMRSNRRRTES